MADRLLSYQDLRERGVPYRPEHLARLEKAGKFPVRLKLSYRCVRWLEGEVDGWVAARAAERDMGAAA